MSHERMTISLPAEQVAFIRQRAKATRLPISEVIGRAVRAVQREDRNRRISAELLDDLRVAEGEAE